MASYSQEQVSALVKDCLDLERDIQKAALTVLHVDAVHQKTVREIVESLVSRILELERTH